ncbi:MAG: polysaccharide biosynthesis C-terminal domain-containing protein, partial [Bacteroidales bacterium]|nr:polysaccharide biosynthesis C-terminal domain-containing protein [Bacteroidales bacterium]
MTKKFTESIFILLVLNLLVKPFWIFAIDVSIQNRVGANQYGLYFSLFSFSLLFNILADLGITNYNNRNIAQNHHLIAQQVGRILPVKLLLGLIYAMLTIIAAFLIGYSSIQVKLLIWLSVNQIIISTTQYLRSNISGLQLFKTDSLISISDKFFLIIICSYLLWWNVGRVFKIEWLIYAQTIAYGSSMVIALIVVLKNSEKISFRFNIRKASNTLRKSFPFAILLFLMVLYTRIDAVMLERLLPDGKMQAGIYAQAFRILDALSMFAFLFASILLPLFAKMIKQNLDIKETLGHSFALLMIPSVGLLAVLYFYAGNFMQTLYHQHVKESSEVLQLLLIGFIGICASYIFGTLLTAAGHLKVLNRIALAAVLLNIVLNALLIPTYGPLGAAFSSMLTQVLMGVLQGIISIVHFKIKIRAITLLKYSIIFASLVALTASMALFVKV